MHWELDIGDALRLALGRAFAVRSPALLTMPLLVLQSLPVSSGFRPPCKVLSWSHWCVYPGHVGVSPGSPPRHSIGGSPMRSVLVRTVTCATNSPPWSPICLVSLSTSWTIPSQSGRTPCTPFNLPPSASRLWGLAHCGHDHSSPGRLVTSRALHLLLLPWHGSLTRHLSACPFHHNARAAWAPSNSINL